jgi:hypothetical protein
MRHAVDETDHRSREAAYEAVCAGRDGLEHRLHVGGRRGDHLEDVGRGGLPFERLLRLVEQPHVLDGDKGLVHKCADQFDLAIRIGAGLRPHQREYAFDAAFPDHRYGEHGPISPPSGPFDGVILGI